MKRVGILSCNIYGNFTNYGSALQSWALCRTIKKISPEKYEPVIIDYCPNSLENADILNPVNNMWDTDKETRELCKKMLPAIRVNYEKFINFFNKEFVITDNQYNVYNFEAVTKERIDAYICGSDTIFCLEEFGGFDDVYYANCDCMKNGVSLAYAASFGDTVFDESTYPILNDRINNFKAIGLREERMVEYVSSHTDAPVKRVVDPTLLLESDEYNPIIDTSIKSDKKYVLLYSRRYDADMEKYAIELAEKNDWDIIEISLRADNAKHHKLFYEAGVEEFLALVKNAVFVVTNSFHGAIFAVQFNKQFCVFSREQANNKILELLDMFGLSERLTSGNKPKDNLAESIDYKNVNSKIEKIRKESIEFLKEELEKIYE